MDEKWEKKWRDSWFYEYLVGEKGRMELVGLGYFLPRLTKMFSSWIEDKIEEKTITKIRTKKPLCIVQTMWKPQCDVFFFFLSFLLLIYFIFYFLWFSTFLRRLLSFSGTFHSFKIFFFSFVLVSFFWFIIFLFPSNLLLLFYFYLVKAWE